MARRVETLETARELADRVASVLPDAKKGTTEAEVVKVPEPIKPEHLKMDNLYLSVEKIHSVLPAMVDQLVAEFFGYEEFIEEDDEGRQVVVRIPRSSTKERRSIFRDFAKFALTEERLAKEMGLLRESAANNGGVVNLNQFNITQIRHIPGAVDRELRKVADGG